MRYMVRNLRCTVTIDSVLANSKPQNACLFTVHAIFRHDYPLATEPASLPRPLVQKKTLRDSLPIDMLLSAVSFLVVAQSSSEFPEGLMNNPVFLPVLVDHEHALPFSQPPTTYRYPERDESIPSPFIVLVKYSLCIPSTPSPCKGNLSFWFSSPNSVLISVLTMPATCPTDLIPP